MALITCPKCGNRISEHASACPCCGISMTEAQILIQQQAEIKCLAAEREAKEAEEARIAAEQRAEWWKKNGKKARTAIVITIVLISALIAVVKIHSVYKAKCINQQIEATFAAGDSCVNIYKFYEAEQYYKKALFINRSQETSLQVSSKLGDLCNARKKANDEYEKVLRRLQILLDADEGEFNQYSNECLDKMIEIYPDRQETTSYRSICSTSLSDNPDYETEGDALFAEGQYEKAVKKYNAVKVVAELKELNVSVQVDEKTNTASMCEHLLTQATEADNNDNYEEAEGLYEELYALHALPSYQAKITSLKRKVKEEAFRKSHENTIVNGHTAVDMGLCVKWADCNVGAHSPSESGNYYAWGETSEKTTYSLKTYKYYSNNKLLKYCSYPEAGMVDNKGILDISDDAAAVNWGGAWRTPTKEQWEELADNKKCRWEWTNQSGVLGYKIISKITGNSIFLPLIGFKAGGSQIVRKDLGLYWTSTGYLEKRNDNFYGAYRFDISAKYYNCARDHRSNGRPIRAVCK